MGLLAALLAAIYPAFIDNNEQFLSEPIAAFTLTGAVLGFLWAGDPGRRVWAWLVPGAMLGRDRAGATRVPDVRAASSG